MARPKVGFITYGVHKDGLQDPMGTPFIDDKLVKSAKRALREAGLELREDIDTVLQPGMVVSMEPMIMIPEGQPGAGGYREHDIVVITEDGNRNITGFPYGAEFNIVRN